MDKREDKAGLSRLAGYLVAVTLGISVLPGTTPANETNRVNAVPDYGENDCVSFKYGTNTNPLNFTFGYACVSEYYCEVSAHGCIDDHCHYTDYSKGARTALTNVSIAARIDSISMGAAGKDLKSHARWCLVQDGAGNFWALDKNRGTNEGFSLNNQHETIIPCQFSDNFSSDKGCVAARQ
ncbi:MAG: hypothetical protein ACPG51_05585 [Thiolinea sp.]